MKDPQKQSKSSQTRTIANIYMHSAACNEN